MNDTLVPLKSNSVTFVLDGPKHAVGADDADDAGDADT